MATAETIKICLPPNQSSYNVVDSSAQYLRAQLEGGQGRFRRDILGSSVLVNAEWTVDCRTFNYLQAASRVFINEVTPFLIDLIIGEATMTEVKAWFIPKTFKLSRVNGLIYTISAQLEVEPPEYDISCDLFYINIYNTLGTRFYEHLNAIDDVINNKFSEIGFLMADYPDVQRADRSPVWSGPGTPKV